MQSLYQFDAYKEILTLIFVLLRQRIDGLIEYNPLSDFIIHAHKESHNLCSHTEYIYPRQHK